MARVFQGSTALSGQIAGTTGIATFPAAAEAANGVSLAEVTRYTSDIQLSKIATKTVTFTAAAYEINTAVAVFTVTGNVMARAVGVVSTAIQADSGNDGTISLGVEDNVAILLPVVVANETNFAVSDIWADATTTKEADVFENGGNWVAIGGGEDIEINVLVEDITAGVIDLYLEWRPLSSGATVVAA